MILPLGGSITKGFYDGGSNPSHSFSGSVPSLGKKSSIGEVDFFLGNAAVITDLIYF